jgi:hypothetical protein
VEQATGEGLSSVSLAVGPGSEKVLHKDGMMADRILGLDGHVE